MSEIWRLKVKGIQKLNVKLEVGIDPIVDIEIDSVFFLRTLTKDERIKLMEMCKKLNEENSYINLVHYERTGTS